MIVVIRVISVANFLDAFARVCSLNYIYDNCHDSKENTITNVAFGFWNHLYFLGWVYDENDQVSPWNEISMELS
jgi:hypothetical protein